MTTSKFRVVLADGTIIETAAGKPIGSTGIESIGEARRVRKQHPGSHIEVHMHDGWKVIK
jgi:hypothetical protein